MNKQYHRLYFTGGSIAIFFICLALIGMEATRNWGIGCMLLGGGLLSLFVSSRATSPFEYVLGGLGFGTVLASCFFIFEAIKLLFINI